MGKRSEIGEKGRNTRERLVTRGFSLFIKKGVSDVSLDDILRYSGVKKGAFYYYFESKDEFLRACFEECYARPALEALDEFYTAEACSVEEIAFFFTHLAALVKEKMDALLGEYTVELNDVYANISYISRRAGYMAAHYAEFQDRQGMWVEKCLLRMRDKGLIPSDTDCAEVAYMMCCCREGAFMMGVRGKEIDFDRSMHTFLGYFERILNVKNK